MSACTERRGLVLGCDAIRCKLASCSKAGGLIDAGRRNPRIVGLTSGKWLSKGLPAPDFQQQQLYIRVTRLCEKA
jgi:hypothetical protein